jgi:hypothetical protein
MLIEDITAICLVMTPDMLAGTPVMKAEQDKLTFSL